MSDELKPCPFCGITAYIEEAPAGGTFMAGCWGCHCNVGEGYDRHRQTDKHCFRRVMRRLQRGTVAPPNLIQKTGGRMRRLTKAQKRVLEHIDDLGLCRYFDVWSGHFWKLGPSKVTGRTAEVLIESGMIRLEDEIRVYSGRRKAVAAITEAGQAALAQQEKAGADG